jgi:rubrerythrin
VQRVLLTIVLLAVAGTSGPAAAAAPSEKERKAQVDYAKKLYGEGVAAMEAKDFTTALARFKDAYRYAPDLHLFTYNIAAAAEAAGDCSTARTYYTMFLDLVPEHPERQTVRATVERMVKECPYEPQATAEIVSPESVDNKKRAADREDEEAERALREAFEAVEKAVELYSAVASRNGGAQPFKRVAAAKKRHHKRMLKLFASHDLKPAPEDEDEAEKGAFVPETVKEACNVAASHEKKSARLFEEVTNVIDTREMWRVMNRYRRASDGRFRNAFENACPKS